MLRGVKAMSQGKTSTIKEVPYNSIGYYLGLDYLTRNHPDNSHLRSCYEGVSFRNLVQCITFDRGTKVFKLDRYLKRPKRFVLISTSGEITGVMVTASLPEFYQEIEYEDYVVIGTGTSSNYDKFLSHLSFDGKAEIVTFNAKHVQLVRSRFSVNKIHNWTVFSCKRKTSTDCSANIRLMNSGDFAVAQQLSKELPEESSPFRSLQFQLKGLPHKNYVLSFDDTTSVFIGVCPYSAGICQLNYLAGSSVSSDLLLAAIRVAIESAHASGCELIWRLRKNDVLKNKSLIKQSCLVELAKESHLHLS
jgi:hypothetical protein